MKSIVTVTAIAALSALFTGALAATDKPTASELLTQINAIQIPKPDQSKAKDPDYRKQFIADRNKAISDRNKLILELYQDYPDNPELPDLMEKRWQTAISGPIAKDTFANAIQETAGVASSTTNSKLKQTALYYETTFKLDQAEYAGDKPDAKQMLADVHSYTAAYPTDDKGADLLVQITYATNDVQLQADVDREIVAKYPKSREVAFAAGGVRRAEGVGKPFELAFDDAVTGKHVSMSDLKGKVVVIDFWATWCGPCVGEMPHMKELYAKYHDKGLEVVGVSLDQPEATAQGLTKLKKFVADNQIPWIQYYQGNFWDSKFSTSWGINSIPRVFIVDKSGNLADADGGRGADLEGKVSKLLGN